MTYLFDYIDRGEFFTGEREGDIRVAFHPSEPLAIACYTHQVMKNRNWNPTVRKCRGLIWNHETLEIVAIPFSKFFNQGEKEAYKPGEHEDFVVFDKLDGSLGILYPKPSGGYAVATKGSFTSEQALEGTKMWEAHIEADRIFGSVTKVPKNLTPLFEIIYPENRIVVDYGGTSGLALIGLVDNRDGYSYHPSMWWGWNGMTVNEYPKVIADRPNAEGLVVWYPETDKRVKLKQQDYIEKHRVVTNLSEETVWDWWSEGKKQEDIDLPEEHDKWAKDLMDSYHGLFWGRQVEIETLWDERPVPSSKPGYEHRDRQVYALWLRTKNVPKFMTAAMFARYDKNWSLLNDILKKSTHPKKGSKNG